MSYLLLGATVCLAAHLLVALSLALGVASAAPRLEARLLALEPARRADVLLRLALLPAAGGLAAALLLALPAWLVHEPRGRIERPGPVLLALGALGALLVIARVSGALADAWRTARTVRQWCARARALPRLPLRATCVDDAAPAAALAGVLRPRLLLSRALVAALEPDELEAVIEHERAHLAARENLKRLLLRASPDPLALLPSGRRLRAAFEEAAELAADRAACARVSPLRLARALLKTAALASSGPELAAAALHREGCVARRVRELLRAHDQGAAGRLARPPRRPAWVVAGVALAIAFVIASLLPGVHAALESLVQLLS